MPRDNHLRRRDLEFLRDLLDHGQRQSLADLLGAPERAVRLEEQAALLGKGEQVRLRVEYVQLDLVDGRLDFERVGGEVLQARNVEAIN